MTENYTGSDLSILVRDSMMQPIRKIQHSTHFKKVQEPDKTDPNKLVERVTPCNSGDRFKIWYPNRY